MQMAGEVSQGDVHLADMLRRLSETHAALMQHVAENRAYQAAMTEKVDTAFVRYDGCLEENKEYIQRVEKAAMDAMNKHILFVDWFNFITKIIAAFLTAVMAVFGFIWAYADARFWHHAWEAAKAFMRREGL